MLKINYFKWTLSMYLQTICMHIFMSNLANADSKLNQQFAITDIFKYFTLNSPSNEPVLKCDVIHI